MRAPRGWFSSSFCFLFVFLISFLMFLSFVIGFCINNSRYNERRGKASQKKITAKPSSYLLCLLYKFTSFYWIFFPYFLRALKQNFFTLYMLSQYECGLYCCKKWNGSHNFSSSISHYHQFFVSRRFPPWINSILTASCQISTQDVAKPSCLCLFAHNSLLVFFAAGKICVIK